MDGVTFALEPRESKTGNNFHNNSGNNNNSNNGGYRKFSGSGSGGGGGGGQSKEGSGSGGSAKIKTNLIIKRLMGVVIRRISIKPLLSNKKIKIQRGIESSR